MDTIDNEINKLDDFFRSNSKALGQIFAPIFSDSQQLKLLHISIRHLNLSVVTQNFLAILVKNRRLNFLQHIASCFKDELLKYKNEKKVYVISAEKMTQEDQELIQERLTEFFSNKVHLTFTEQADIFGGIILKYDNKIYDASLKNRFNQLNKIIENRISLL